MKRKEKRKASFMGGAKNISSNLKNIDTLNKTNSVGSLKREKLQLCKKNLANSSWMFCHLANSSCRTT